MNAKVRNAVIIATAVIMILALLLLIVSMSGIPLSNLKYVFQSKPVMPERDLGEKKDTSEREAIVMTTGYDSLDGYLQDAYDTIDEYINLNESEQFYVSCSHDDFIRVYRAYLNDHPEIFWLNVDNAGYRYRDYGDSVEVECIFAFDGDNLSEMKQELSDKVEKIMSDAPADASDYELELYFNDYLTKAVTYDKEQLSPMRGNAYGALMYGRVVCAGYSSAFQLLCNRAGIECESVFGNITKKDGEDNNVEENSLHQWNCVKIEGDWYYTDVTWNDISDKNSSHAYFNITSEEIKRTRSINPLYEDDPELEDYYWNSAVHDCSSDEYNYYKKTGTEITDPGDDSEIIAVLLAATEKKQTNVDFRMSDGLDYEKVFNSIAKDYAYRWIEGVNYYNGGNPSLNPATELYYYKMTHCIVFKLEYR